MKNLFKILSIFLFIPSLQAVNYTENINVGTESANNTITVHGESRLRGLTTVGTSDTNANLKVWGNASVCGNTTVAEKDCCKRILGLVENFDPHKDQLAIKFCDTADGNHGAFVQLHFCGICTENGMMNGNDTIPVTTIAKGFYLHPNDADKCFDVNGLTRINEADGNTTIDVGCELELLFRKNNINKLCVGLANQKTTSIFSNSSTITVPDSGSATPYPSNIAVSIPNATEITKVTVTLTGLEHTFPDDIDILLVSPTGEKVLLLSDSGGAGSITDVNLTFDDAATDFLPSGSFITSGTYKPTNYGGGDNFAAPAPAGPYASLLSAFNGNNPNGTWLLYVMDDAEEDIGQILNGWSITIETKTNGETFYAKEGTHTYEPGCLFYTITSCNLENVSITSTENLSFDALSASTQALIASITSDTDEQEAIADTLVGFDEDFLTLFEALNESTRLAIIYALFNDLSRGAKISVAEKIKECMKAKNSKKLLSALFEELKAKHKIRIK